jgi:GxxExxY protein
LYNEILLRHTYKADIICYDKIILELKAVSKISNEYKAQLMNYLVATNYKVGLLVSFGSHPKAEIIRIAH